MFVGTGLFEENLVDRMLDIQDIDAMGLDICELERL